jgi:VanZ family protein
MRLLKSENLWGLLLIIYCSAIFYVSSSSNPTGEMHLPTGPLPHVIEYGMLGFLAHLFFKTISERKMTPFITLIFCMGFAVSDEIHQFFVPIRSCDPEDILMDLIGSSAGIIALWISFKIRWLRWK